MGVTGAELLRALSAGTSEQLMKWRATGECDVLYGALDGGWGPDVACQFKEMPMLHVLVS